MIEISKILIVDDEKNVLRSLRRLFLDEEYEILTAESGQEGLDILTAQPEIQVVISDYRMPGMDGVDFLKQVYEIRPDTIRIVLSGYADSAAIVAAINEGKIYKFIPKPWNDLSLKNNIAKAIEVFHLQRKNKELTDKLIISNNKLKHLNENLELLVEKKTKEVLFQNRSLRMSQNILHSLPVAVIGLDIDGLIVQINALAERLFSNNLPAIIQMKASDVLPPVIQEHIVRANETGFSHGIFTMNQENIMLLVVKMQENSGQEGFIVTCIKKVE